MDIIIKDSKPKGRTRTSLDKQLQDTGWGSSFKNAEDANKCEYVERKLKALFGSDTSNVSAKWINAVDKEK